ncbi:TraR/DksA family transcriptional regulator [Halioxenophilus sp. WMMB6]|uniref:TraR/DksA family transcriptional regulator n=1 Tax=Halioxenophilus sp. WMMB6 TaxID=3073815 RepID=UPI00295E5FB7|nr:TraR/DksA family transcriptional regulator [Halioxenophilus sp. WMMB6]
MNLPQIEQQLRSQLDVLQQRLQKITSDLTQPHSADSEEQAQERENDEVLERIAQETRESISHINAALARIADGSYGVCEACGDNIAPARLMAIPEATLCVKCAS